MRGPIVVNASAIDPDCAEIPTCPLTKESEIEPIHGDPPGFAIPMQFCPMIIDPLAAARSRMRAAINGPSAPASLPSPGKKKARVPRSMSS